MIKTINYCAIVAVALAIQIGGLQNCVTAQEGYSSPGGFNRSASGQDIVLIPSWDLDDAENSQQSFYQPPRTPEDNGNVRSYSPVPPTPYPDGQRNFSSEANRVQNRFQGPPKRAEFQQSYRPERGSYRRGPNRNMNYQASYSDFAQRNEQRPPGGNWGNHDPRYGAYRQELVDTEARLVRPEGRQHHGGCRGGCGSRHQGSGYDATTGSGSRLRPGDSQFDQPLPIPNQFPSNEADQQPSLRVPYPLSRSFSSPTPIGSLPTGKEVPAAA